MLKLVNGQLEPGRSWLFWLVFVALVAFMAFVPSMIGRYALLNLNSFLLMTFLAVWK